jgi:hypothetical protein
MGIAAEILDHLLRSAERRFGVDYPFGLADGSQVCSEGGRAAQGFQIAEEAELTVGVGLGESLQEKTPE